MMTVANAQPEQKPKVLGKVAAGRAVSFAALKQIDAGELSVGYAEAGPASGPAVVLLHGWPYDIYSFADVAPLLAAKGYRVIVPWLRGYGTTRFLSDTTVRNGQQSVVAVDIIALMDALKIEQADRRRLRLGRAHCQYHGGAVAAALQGHGVGKRLSHRQRRGQQQAAAAGGGIVLVVSILFRHRRGARPAMRSTGAIRHADLAVGFAEMGVRRCHLQPQRRRV